ncbi:MAG TPA: 2-amino-4-hydroxy-6-hydroxymethyldihydropteridine diphosphokinase, partial [Gaiella sp.]
DRRAAIERAVELLDAHPDVSVVAVSAIRETEPWGPVEQGPFLNAAAAVDTTLAPGAFLYVLLGIEETLGRVRGERWGPRTVDLDLLLYGELVLEEPELVVPHPRLHERRFVLEPLAELAPDAVVPGRGRVSDLLAALTPEGRG